MIVCSIRMVNVNVIKSRVRWKRQKLRGSRRHDRRKPFRIGGSVARKNANVQLKMPRNEGKREKFTLHTLHPRPRSADKHIYAKNFFIRALAFSCARYKAGLIKNFTDSGEERDGVTVSGEEGLSNG